MGEVDFNERGLVDEREVEEVVGAGAGASPASSCRGNYDNPQMKPGAE